MKVLGRAIRLANPGNLVQDDDPLYRAKPRPTDINEQEWLRISHFFPEKIIRAHNRRTPIRLLMNAVLFRLENDLTLRDVPRYAPDFPPWGSLHYFEGWLSDHDLWDKIIAGTGREHLFPKLPKMIHRYHKPRRRRHQVTLSHVKVLGRVIAMSHEDGPRKACLMVGAPPSIAAQVLAFGSMIPDDDLVEEGDRVTNPHVTIKYGLDDDCTCTKEIVADADAPIIHLGKLNIFRQDDEDVLYVDVSSDRLKNLRARLDAELGKDENHPTYVPHMTVACLKKDRGDKYIGQDFFEGLCFQPEHAMFSPSEGEVEFVPFKPEHAVVAMSVEKKVLGRVLRLATPPKEVSDPVIHMEHPGYVHLPKDLEDRRGSLGTSSTDRRKASLDVVKKAVRNGSHAVDVHSVGDHHIVLVGDKDGNVTAHHKNTIGNSPIEKSIRSGFHGLPVYGNYGFIEERKSGPWREEGGRTDSDKFTFGDVSRHFADRHEKAVKEGKLFAKANFKTLRSDSGGYGHDPRDWMKDDRGLMHDQHDPSASLIYADLLDENDYSRAAKGIRRREYDIATHDGSGGFEGLFKKAHIAGAYPDTFDMLTRHERTPEQDETKKDQEGFINYLNRPTESSYDEDTNTVEWSRDGADDHERYMFQPTLADSKIGWRLSYEKGTPILATKILGRKICRPV